MKLKRTVGRKMEERYVNNDDMMRSSHDECYTWCERDRIL